MIVKRVNSDTPEQMFIIVLNSWSTASLTTGCVVGWDYTVDADGVGVTRLPARAVGAGYTVAGVIAQTIASGSYGLMQVYGYHSAVRVRCVTGGANDIAAGSPIAGVAAGSLFHGESFNTGSDQPIVYPFAFALEAYSSYTSGTTAAFIKTL